MRLIDENGKQIGIVPLEKALKEAQKRNLDLVEIAPMANPPVCRIMDYSKMLYEEKKREKAAKKKQKKIIIKELKFSAKIEENDFNIKIKKIKSFLESGYRVKISIFLRGRELLHPELGEHMKEKIIEALKDYGEFEHIGKLQGRTINLLIVPPKK